MILEFSLYVSGSGNTGHEASSWARLLNVAWLGSTVEV